MRGSPWAWAALGVAAQQQIRKRRDGVGAPSMGATLRWVLTGQSWQPGGLGRGCSWVVPSRRVSMIDRPPVAVTRTPTRGDRFKPICAAAGNPSQRFIARVVLRPNRAGRRSRIRATRLGCAALFAPPPSSPPQAGRALIHRLRETSSSAVATPGASGAADLGETH